MKNVLVTGGTTGIGLAAAQLFLERGNNVWISGRSADNLNSAQSVLNSDQLQTLVADTTKLGDIDKVSRTLQEQNVKLDVLFLNAGIAVFSTLESATESEFDAQFNTNVKGVFFTIQKLIPVLNEGASIVINGSTNATASGIGSSVYSATKAAVIKIAKIAANELAPKGIRVNVVSPGPTLTPGLKDAVGEGALSFLSEKTAMQRLAEPNEIAKAVYFLASDEASFVTGTELIVDGGLINYSLK